MCSCDQSKPSIVACICFAVVLVVLIVNMTIYHAIAIDAQRPRTEEDVRQGIIDDLDEAILSLDNMYKVHAGLHFRTGEGIGCEYCLGLREDIRALHALKARAISLDMAVPKE